jgi:hypothetical protein
MNLDDIYLKEREPQGFVSEVSETIGDLGSVAKTGLDMAASGLKGVTQGGVGLLGDLSLLSQMIANKMGANFDEETFFYTTEEVKKMLDENKVPGISNFVDTSFKPINTPDSDFKPETVEFLKRLYDTSEFTGEMISPAIELDLIAKGIKTAVKTAPKIKQKTGEFVEGLDESVLRPTGSIQPGALIPQKINAQKQPAVQRTTDDFGFYSKALEETQKLKQEKGTGQQFKQMLLKSGVKQEEIDWLGLEDVFKEKKITKDDIVKHINDNRIKLREVVATGESKVNMEFGEGVKLTPAQSYGDNYINERAYELMDEADTSQNEVYGATLDYDDAVKMAEEEYYDDPIMKYVDSKTGYTITGNDNLGYSIFQSEAETVGQGAYQNAFATSGGRKRYDMRRDESGDLEIYSLDEAEVQARGLAENQGDLSMQGDTRWSDHVEPDGENYQELRFQLDDDEVKFTEGVHFSDDENNLFHIRTTDRDYDGEKVLYVEELQSDWGQTGRDRGFKPEKKEEKILNDKVTTIRKELKNKLNEYTVLEDNGTKTSFVDFEIKKLKDSIKRANPDVPDDAPIMKDVENDLIVTNIFNQFLDAVAEGKIFKNNEQIQGNFKNRMVNGVMTLKSDAPLDFISLEKLAKDNRNLQIKLSPSLPERSPFVTSTDKWTQLAIKRLLSKAIDEGYDYVSFSPGDVQYERWNNKGLITYYDYIVPKNAEKVLKKIDKNAITYTRRNELDLDEDRAAIGKESLQELQTKSKIPDTFFDNLYEKKNNNVLLKKGLFTIKITPKVKDSVGKGQSMFSLAPIAAGSVAVSQGENNGN